MKTSLSTLFLLFFISVDGFSQQGVFKSDVVVDGDLSEWGEKLDHYDKENQLWYSIANDADFLYLAILKDKHALKSLSDGKVQIYISEDQITEASPSIIYPIDVNELGYWFGGPNWDFLVVSRGDDAKRDTLSVFNELGIEAQGRLVETEEAKEEKKRLEALGPLFKAARDSSQTLSASTGMTAYFEFALPIKHLKSVSGNLNIELKLKGDSDKKTPDDIRAVQRYLPESAFKRELLDISIKTEYSFTYRLKSKN